ncbi:uncharacterized protein LOC143433807 [Arvicanthis niloticus]|uniref:uncharacterized protein LOC143433807 n=1 Tax=Arvicanthis niloticus TaxID=61156 RepID=UPI00402B481F
MAAPLPLPPPPGFCGDAAVGRSGVRGEPDRKSPRGSPGTGSSAASPGGRAPPPFRRRSPALPGSGSASQRPSAAAGETGCGVWRGEGCGAADGRGGRGLAKVKERAINPEPGRHPDRVSYIITLESLVVDPPLQQPTWDDCQQLLQVLLTSEERQSVFQEARKQALQIVQKEIWQFLAGGPTNDTSPVPSGRFGLGSTASIKEPGTAVEGTLCRATNHPNGTESKQHRSLDSCRPRQIGYLRSRIEPGHEMESPPYPKPFKDKIFMLLVFLYFANKMTSSSPHAPKSLTWEVLNSQGDVVWSVSGTHALWTWYPELYPDLCKLATGAPGWDFEGGYPWRCFCLRDCGQRVVESSSESQFVCRIAEPSPLISVIPGANFSPSLYNGLTCAVASKTRVMDQTYQKC